MDKISALMDGELDEHEARRAVLQLKDIGTARESWATYHVIGDVLRGESLPAFDVSGRVAAAVAGKDAVGLSREIGRALWEREENIAEAGVLDAAAARAWIDAADLRRSAAPGAELDAIWAANTQEALGRGIFGAPSYRLGSGELFWGQDRLEFLDRALARA